MTSYYVDKDENYYRYKEDRDRGINIVSTKKQREEWHNEAVWLRLENGRLNDMNGFNIPGPNANDKDWKEYGQNVVPSKAYKTRPHLLEEAKKRGFVEEDESTSKEEVQRIKIMPDDPNFTPLEKALNWAGEAKHGPEHQDRWRQISVSLGAPIKGVEAMPLVDVVMWWKKFNKNPRWSMALDNLVKGDFDNLEQKAAFVLNEQRPDAEDAPSLKVKEMEVSAEEMDFYHNGPPVQGHFTIEEWRHMYGVEPKVVNVRRWKRQAIIDPALGQPNYWLEGQEVITAQNWDYENGEWKYLGARGPGPHDIGQAGTSGIAPTGTLATPDLAGSVETVVENCSEDDLKKILAMIMKKLGM